MGYDILFRPPGMPEEEVGGLYFGSGTDLMTLREWVEALPAATYPRLAAFFENSVTNDVDRVCGELDLAIDSHPPEDEYTEDVVHKLFELLDRWPDLTQAMISDGANDQEWPEPDTVQSP